MKVHKDVVLKKTFGTGRESTPPRIANMQQGNFEMYIKNIFQARKLLLAIGHKVTI